jgi:uncharacterized protein YbbC (DUF1343 family)
MKNKNNILAFILCSFLLLVVIGQKTYKPVISVKCSSLNIAAIYPFQNSIVLNNGIKVTTNKGDGSNKLWLNTGKDIKFTYNVEKNIFGQTRNKYSN